VDYNITFTDIEPAIAAMNKDPIRLQEALANGMRIASIYLEGRVKEKTPEANTRVLRPGIKGYPVVTPQGVGAVVDSAPNAIAYAHVIEHGYHSPIPNLPKARLYAWAKYKEIPHLFGRIWASIRRGGGIKAQEPFGRTYRVERPVIERMILSEVEKI